MEITWQQELAIKLAIHDVMDEIYFEGKDTCLATVELQDKVLAFVKDAKLAKEDYDQRKRESEEYLAEQKRAYEERTAKNK